MDNEPKQKWWDRWWIKATYRVGIFIGSISASIILILIGIAVFRGDPDHSEIADRLERIESLVEFNTCLITTGPGRTTADIAACQGETGVP